MVDELTELTLEDVKQKLDAGEPLENVRFERLTRSKHEFTSPVVLTDCQIDTLDLNKSTFHEEVILRRCRIKTLILSGATFEKKCDLKKSTIGRIRLQDGTFQEGMNCQEATFHSGTYHKCTFEGDAVFGWTKFGADATFSEVQFQGKADFRHAAISGTGVFEQVKCAGNALFSDAVFDGEVKMRDSEWHDDFTLRRGQVKLGIDMTSAVLNGCTDFRDLTVGRTINLNRAQLGEQQGFRFLGLVAAAVAMQRSTIEGHVHPEQKGQYAEAADEYGFLRVMLQQIHRYDDEDWAYYQYKRMRRMCKPLDWNPANTLVKVGSLVFLDWGCGYGTRPFRTLFACAVMVLVFALGYWFALQPEHLVREYSSVEALDRVAHAVDYSLTAFSGEYSSLPFKGPWRLLAMLEYSLGVVFLGLFIVALSRKVIR